MGGGIFGNGGTLTLADDTFTNDAATGGSGGAGKTSNGTAGQGLGGAVFDRNGAITALNDTISGNTAAQGGRGIYLLGDGTSATATINNTIIGQSDTLVSDFFASSINGGSTTTSGVGNLIRTQTGFSGTIVSTADPVLSALAANGGPTETMALASTSPAVDAGNNTAASSLAYDQRGGTFARKVGIAVDIGAFEVQSVAASPSLTVTTASPLALGTTPTGTAGSATSFTVGGTNLTANVLLTAPSGVELSSDGTNYSTTLTETETSGTLATSTIYARITSGASVGGISGSIAITSSGATEQDVTVTGTVNAAAPSVTTSAATTITTAGATLNGNVTADGGATITGRGFIYGTDPTLTTGTTADPVTGTTGIFSDSPSGLSAGTKYYFEAYATNSTGTTDGTIQQFTTSTPTIAVTAASPLALGTVTTGTAGSATAFTVGGSNLTTNVSLTAPAGVELSSDGTHYSTTLTETETGGTLATTTIYARITSGASVGSISGHIAITSTSATEQDVTVSGTVNAAAPSVTTSAATTITTAGATLNGNVTADGGATIISRGFIYGTDPTLTTGTTTDPVTGTTGIFSDSPIGLSAGTKYYFEAYATNSTGTTDGTIQQFTTSTPAPAPTVTLTSPTSASSTNNNNKPTFSGAAGTAIGNSTTITVKIYSGTTVKGTLVQTLTATASAGSYSVSPATSLLDGTYTAQASQAGTGATGYSAADTFTIDTVAPVVTLTAPASSSTTTNTTPTFAGTAGTASGDLSTITIKIFKGASATGTLVETLTTTASGGTYSIPASTALIPGTYTAQASQSDAAGNTGTSTADTFTIQTATVAIVQLTGTASANTTASYNNAGNTFANAFDGNTSTFFDAPTANGNWVQLNLGSPRTITQIAYAPRVASGGFPYEPRMVGGYFEGSNDPTFSTGVTTLYTITSTPPDGLTKVAVSGTYQYIRYVSPAGSYGNIAEMQVFGPAPVVAAPNPPGTPTLVGSATPSSISIKWSPSTTAGVTGYLVLRNGAQVASTSSTTLTFTDTLLNPSTQYTYTVEAVAAGVDSLPSGPLVANTLAAPTIVQLTGTASANTTASWNNVGNTFANAFDGNTNTFFDAPNANGNWVQLNLGSSRPITQIAYAPRVGFEFRMVGGYFEGSNDPSFSTGVTVLYTISSTPADGLTKQAVSGTYQYVRYVSPAGSYGNIAEFQVFGTAAVVTAAPGTPTLVSSTSTSATIAWTPSATTGVSGYIVFRNGVQIGTTNSTTLTFADSMLLASTKYTYTVEAVANGLASVASGPLVVTTAAAAPTPTKLTGTTIGTTGSYDGKSTDAAAAAFDGNLNTFFDAPTANGNWVGLDLGTNRTITSITFAPRQYGYESRMVGGMFQVSNNASFSTANGGVVDTLYTITTTPADGYTTITIPPASSPGAFRYVRYLAPNGSYGNIAEMQVSGY